MAILSVTGDKLWPLVRTLLKHKTGRQWRCVATPQKSKAKAKRTQFTVYFAVPADGLYSATSAQFPVRHTQTSASLSSFARRKTTREYPGNYIRFLFRMRFRRHNLRENYDFILDHLGVDAFRQWDTGTPLIPLEFSCTGDGRNGSVRFKCYSAHLQRTPALALGIRHFRYWRVTKTLMLDSAAERRYTQPGLDRNSYKYCTLVSSTF